MNGARHGNADPQSGRSQAARPRWIALYVILAIVNILTIGGGVYLGTRSLALHRATVTTSLEWDARRSTFSALAPTLAALDAPANDIFYSRDVKRERARLDTALMHYALVMGGIRETLRDARLGAARTSLESYFDQIDTAIPQIVQHAQVALDEMSAGHVALAASQMALMDQVFDGTNRALESALQTFDFDRRTELREQFAQADALYRRELALAAVAILLVGGIALYGRLLAKSFAEAQDERDAQHVALRSSELEYQYLSEELESRVKDRTAELSRSSEDLARSEADLRLLIGAMNDIVAVFDNGGTCLRVFATRQQPATLSAEEMLGRTVAEMLPPDTAQYVLQKIAEAQASKRAVEIEYELATAKGPVWFGGTVSSLSDTEVLWVARDVTARLNTARALHQSEAQLVNAQGIARVGSWHWNLLNNELVWSSETYRQLRLDPAVVSPSFERYMAVVHHEDRESIMAMTQHTLATGEELAFDARFALPDGTISHFRSRGHVTRDATGKIIALSGTTQDVTEEKNTQRDLEVARAQADNANAAKGDFLATMSHEIRTPMNGVLGMLELVMDTELTADQREHIDVAHASAESLLTIINDILDFSKIEAGKLDLDLAPFDLVERLSDTLSTLALRAHNKGLELTLDVDEAVPVTVVGDVGRLRQVMINLVGNAIKFTSRGEVAVSVALKHHDGDDIVLHIAVRDTGIGIPSDKQALIFDAFSQADGSTTREYGGTGLGLAISARLVTAMGGTLSVTSQPGTGSTFSFDTHMRVPSGSVFGVPQRASSPSAFRILAVDDNATHRHILEQALLSWNFLPTIAENGAQALAAAREAAAVGAPYAIVIIDAQMPEMDGFGLVEQLLEGPPAGFVPIMMLSAADQARDLARCRELGIAFHVTKPVSPSHLLEAIMAATGTSTAGLSTRRSHTRAVASTTPPLKVLLAEDNAVNQKLAVSLLEKAGHVVTVVSNGQLALDALAREPFDLVLMDVQMPVLGGLEATTILREREGTGRRTPIIALTARAMKEDRERCAEAGMNGYVSKPIRPAELFAEIDRVAERGLEESRAEVIASTAGNSAIEIPALLALIGGDTSLLQELLVLFAEDAPRQLEAIAAAVTSGDRMAIREAAHALQGSAANMQAHAVHRAALALERAAETGDLSRAAVLLATLSRDVSLAMAAVAERAITPAA